MLTSFNPQTDTRFTGFNRWYFGITFIWLSYVSSVQYWSRDYDSIYSNCS